MRFIIGLAVLFILIPVIEFTILIEMGREIGLFYTIVLVFGAGIIGAILAKTEGTRIITKIQESLRVGIMPTEDLFDGLLVLAAGMFLIVPGFLSDVVGLSCCFHRRVTPSVNSSAA
jgi:UPF0716 protein FxsA